MATPDHLKLRAVIIEPRDNWSATAPGGTLCFVLPKDGVARYVAGSASQVLSPGDLLVVMANPQGIISATSSKPAVFDTFSLRSEHMYPVLTSLEIASFDEVMSLLKRPRWYACSHPVAVESHRLLTEVCLEPALKHRGQLLRIATEVLAAEFSQALARRPGAVAGENKLLSVVDHLPVEDLLELSVEDLAAKCNCSRRHLNRLFQQRYHFSVGALKMEIRMLKAISLLRDPSAKVINVAQDCGFNHQGLFNTCFKKRFGVSPGQWRKQTTASETAEAATGGAVAKFDSGLLSLAAMPPKTCGSVLNSLASSPGVERGI